MTELNETTVLSRGKALAAEDGFTWELDFGAPLRRRHFLSEDRRQEYLELARAELRKEMGDA
jgi:hypothetical protein